MNVTANDMSHKIMSDCQFWHFNSIPVSSFLLDRDFAGGICNKISEMIQGMYILPGSKAILKFTVKTFMHTWFFSLNIWGHWLEL